VFSLTFVTITESQLETDKSGQYVYLVFVKRTSCRNTALRLVGSYIVADVSKDLNAFVFEVHLSTFFRPLYLKMEATESFETSVFIV